MKVEASLVSETTRQDASALGSCEQRKFASAAIWTDAMLAALQSGVKGGNAFFADLGALHDVRGPLIGAPIPMWKQLTGEPVAGEPHTGFGGRGQRKPFPTPIPL